MKELTESEKIQNWLSSQLGHAWITREFRSIQWGNAGLFQIKEDIEAHLYWDSIPDAYSCSYRFTADRKTGLPIDESLTKGLSCPA